MSAGVGFWRGLLMARSHIAFLLGLVLAACVIKASGLSGKGGPSEKGVGSSVPFAELLKTDDTPPLQPTGTALTADERRMAQIAWKYFENNSQPATGLVNSNDKFPSTTLWDLGSYMMGLLAARDLGVVDEAEVQKRLELLLTTLAKVELIGPGLPNKAYDTRTLAVVDYNNNPAPGGIGWSAIDIARIGVPFSVVVWRYPQLTDRVRAVLRRWKLDQVVHEGVLQGAEPRQGTLQTYQEGRFGYEQYAAKSLFLLGLDVSRALDYRAFTGVATVEGQKIAYDTRLPGQHGGTHNAVLSEPYILEGVEFGLDEETGALARAVLLAQRNRAQKTGKVTAVSEDNLDRAPYFVYDTVFTDMQPWAAFTPDGKDARAYRTLSTKAAVGWAYLFGGDYSTRLLSAVQPANDPERGWYSGIYESSGELNKALTANTNGIVLETLAYHVQGPWIPEAKRK